MGHRRARAELFDHRTEAALPHQQSVESWLVTAELLLLQLRRGLLLGPVLNR